jgi:integrase
LSHSLTDLIKLRLEVIITSKAFEETDIDDFDKIANCIITSIHKDDYLILPITMDNMFLEKATSRFNSKYRQNHSKYFEYYDHLRRMIKFLNAPCKPESVVKHCKIEDEALITILSEPLIISKQIKPYTRIVRDVVDGFEPEIVKSLEDFYKLRRHFRSTYAANTIDKFTLQYAFLFSLIANGFVSESRILKKINNITTVQVSIQNNTITIPDVANEENYTNIILDEFTAVLLKSYMLHNKIQKDTNVFNIDKDNFNEWIVHLCNEAEVENFSMEEIQFLSKASSAQIFPPYMCSTLSNKLNFVSLSANTVKRIAVDKLHNKKLVIKKLKAVKQPHIPIKKVYKTLEKDVEGYINIGRKMHQAITINSYKESLESLAKVYSTYEATILEFDTLNYLYQCLKYHLENETNRLSTLKDYFTGFYKDLIYNTYNSPLDKMTEEDISELIEKIFFERVLTEVNKETMRQYKLGGKDVKDITRVKQPVKIAAKIRHFFDWYNKASGDVFTEVIYDEIYIAGGRSRIRNTIITAKEFELILSKIDETDIKHKAEIRIMMILGFFAGMRISEIVNLKITDIVNGLESYIYVVKSKSQSGTRRIPVHYLIPSEYLKELLEYHKIKKEQKARHLLFSSIEEQRYIKSSLNDITRAIKNFINDTGYVFHSLRHSFGSILLMRYYSAKYSDFDSFLAKHFDVQDPFGLEIFDKKKLLVLFSAESPDANPNNILWYISIMIGHISPEITIENYMHTIEFYIKYLLNKYRLSLYGTLSKKQILNLIATINSYKALAKHNWNHDDNLPEVNQYLDRKINNQFHKR